MKLWRLLIVLACAASAFAQPAVPPDRIASLARGINLSHWLWITAGRTGDARMAFISAADVAIIREAGLTHVRLPFEPADLWRAGERELIPRGVNELRTAIDRCLAGGLAVIVDAHPTAASPWATVDASGASDDLEAFWAALARELSTTNPDRVFLEILNEPHDIRNPAHWPAAQQRLAKLIRAAAPHHTIIATGDEYGSIPGLLRLKPLPDANVVYSFHFYEPHNFTHQGATWGYPPWRHLKGLPYLSTPEAIDAIAPSIADKQAREAAIWYSRKPINAASLKTHIDKAAAWGREHNVPVYCGEFGVYAEFSPRQSRLAWTRDVAAALREHKIGWAMWDYTGGFALAPGKPGERKLDEPLARALGLQPEAAPGGTPVREPKP